MVTSIHNAMTNMAYSMQYDHGIHNANQEHGMRNANNNITCTMRCEMAYTMLNGFKPNVGRPQPCQNRGHNTKTKAPKDKACMHNALANQLGLRAQLSRVLKE